jgi:hypothetical protein
MKELVLHLFRGFMCIVGFFVIIAMFGIAVMFLWNYLFSSIVGLPEISYSCYA